MISAFKHAFDRKFTRVWERQTRKEIQREQSMSARERTWSRQMQRLRSRSLNKIKTKTRSRTRTSVQRLRIQKRLDLGQEESPPCPKHLSFFSFGVTSSFHFAPTHFFCFTLPPDLTNTNSTPPHNNKSHYYKTNNSQSLGNGTGERQ